jgi:serine/threonine protein kinase
VRGIASSKLAKIPVILEIFLPENSMASSFRSARRGNQRADPEGSRAQSPPNRVPILEEDPYHCVDHLGDGMYGTVDKVEQSGRVYARKRIIFSTGREPDKILHETQREFAILNRLKHRHIIQVVKIFFCKKRLYIVMDQVADTDMKQYLEKVDALGDGMEKDSLRKTMQMWPGCLIQAIDYLHEMRVKHKDLKPANILIMAGQVLIADFGVSKDLIDEETTASKTDAELKGTPLYWAPEVDQMTQSVSYRRGRAVDIYALGCIFLEIATIFMALPGSRAKFAQFRETDGSTAYRKCPTKILNWIWYLWGHWSEYNLAHEKGEVLYNDFIYHGPGVSDLAFLMLDPNPKMRITARQLVTLMSTATDELYYRNSVKSKPAPYAVGVFSLTCQMFRSILCTKIQMS